jgi:hypothetical protein
MLRTFGVQTLTGAAQPWFGDVLTAAFSPTGINKSGFYLVTVANTAKYQIGDRIVLGAGQVGANILLVEKIVSGTVLGCASEGDATVAAWPNGTIIAMDIACAQVIFQAPTSNADPVYLGTDNTVTNAGAGTSFGWCYPGGQYNFGVAQWNTLRTSEGWMAGTASDKVGVVAVII